jgi:uracil-DNA glycosylase family 4
MGIVYNTCVPHIGPIGAKILLVGESPGVDEEEKLEPFVGKSGQLLMETLMRHGVFREEVRLANLCNYRPQNNRFEILEESEDGKRKLVSGLKELIKYIQDFPPNVIAALGEKPLNFITGKFGIQRYRGSILNAGQIGFNNIKVIPARHPAGVLRNQSEYPIFDLDIKRVISDSEFSDFRYTERNYHIIRDGIEAVEWFDRLIKFPILASDIENIEDTTEIICISFAPSPNLSVCYPWTTDNFPFISKLLEANHIEKIFQFGTHDTELLYLNGINTQNYNHDTLIAMHCLEPEFPKGLDFMTSIYTREPYYKKEGRSDLPRDSKVWSKRTEKNSVYVYNSKDSAVTDEIYEKQRVELAEDPAALACYEHEIEMLEVARCISRTGMVVDLELRDEFKKALIKEWNTKQVVLDAIAGKSVNVNSPKDMPWLFYTKLKLPVQRKRASGGKPSAITTDEDALVKLITICADKVAELKQESAKQDWQIKLEGCKLTLEIRGIRKLISSYIDARLSSDNRYRSTYIVAGPETGRWAAALYADATGINSQTLPRGDVTLG